MRNLLIVIALCLIATNADAKWYYLVNQDGIVVAKQNGPARTENLIIDNYTQVETEDDIYLPEAELRNGKIIKHVPTKEERDFKEAKAARKASAVSKLKALGLTDDEISAIGL